MTTIPVSVPARVSAPLTPAEDSPRRARLTAALRFWSSSIAMASVVSLRAMTFAHRWACPVASWAHRWPSQISHCRQAGT